MNPKKFWKIEYFDNLTEYWATYEHYYFKGYTLEDFLEKKRQKIKKFFNFKCMYRSNEKSKKDS